MLGRGDFADCVTIYFKADARDLIGERNLSVIYVNHPEMLAFFRFAITGQAGFLAIFSTVDADGSRDTHVGETMRRGPLHRAGAQRAGLAARPARRDRQRAALERRGLHRRARSPTAGCSSSATPRTSCRRPAGFGGNTGVADAYNLAWKLAKVHSGEAGPGLLDTYNPERRPAATSRSSRPTPATCCGSTRRCRRTTSRPRSTTRRSSSGIVHDSAAVLADGAGPSIEDEPLDNPRTPTRPGRRYVSRTCCSSGAARRSRRIDLVGREFVLLRRRRRAGLVPGRQGGRRRARRDAGRLPGRPRR